MRAAQTIAGLTSFERRGAGSDSERRAAVWLQSQILEQGREARLDTFWCRPNWALAHAWHVALGLAGSLLVVHSPKLGGALILVALLCVAVDELTGLSPGRRLTPERASQNVVSSGAEGAPDGAEPAVRLLITANYDAGRMGFAHHPGLKRPAALRTALARGWLGWLTIALLWLLGVAIARASGAHGSAIGGIQLIPTVALVLALALLLELASSEFGPAAGDNGSGTAVALELTRALSTAPPANMTIELLLQGAGDASGLGLRRHLRARRPRWRASDTIVIGVAACAAGSPRWWASDGPLVPLRYLPRLRELCRQVAQLEPAQETRGRGTTPALPARAARLPAITIGCLDEKERYVHSHRATDTAERVDEDAMSRALRFGLLLVDQLDGFLAERGSAPDQPVFAATPG